MHTAQNAGCHVFEILKAVAEKCPSKKAVIGSGGKGTGFTYEELFESAARLAGVLQHHPYAEAGEIGLISENRPEWPLAYLAVIAAGKTVVPLDVNLTPEEVTGLTTAAKLSAIFTSRKHLDTLRALESGPATICLDRLEDPSDSHTDLETLMAQDCDWDAA